MTRRTPILLLLLFATACSAVPMTNTTSTPPTITASATPQASATPIPTVEATSSGPEVLTLWIPDVLIASGGDEADNLLSQQITAFSDANDDLTIEIRRRQVREVGGIMPTLRTAKNVAPGVLPDLTLIRREDLILAVNEGLVQTMEDVVSTAMIGDLFSSALDVGQVEGTLYALPYAMNAQHVIYRPGLARPDTPALSNYRADEIPFLFPAARASGLNSIFLTQYIAATPRSTDLTTLTVNEETLLALFTFYEEAAAAGLISPEVMNYSQPTEYRALLSAGEFGSAVVSSELYLELTALEGIPEFAVGSIPTISGQPTTYLDGWMWVMTTTNPNRQAVVQSFLEWVMDADRQGEYVRSLNLIPSQRTALRRWYTEDYAAFLLETLPNAGPPYSMAANSSEARAIQNGLLAVISGEQTAESATQDVLSQVAN